MDGDTASQNHPPGCAGRGSKPGLVYVCLSRRFGSGQKRHDTRSDARWLGTTDLDVDVDVGVGVCVCVGVGVCVR